MRLTSQKQAIQQHCRDSDANRAISKVKGRPMEISDMEVEKIDDRAEANPVDDIAHGTPDDEPDRDGGKRARDAAQPKDQNYNDRGSREREEKSVEPAPPLNSQS